MSARKKPARQDQNDLKRPADICQVTLLFDKSDSMWLVEKEARIAIEQVLAEFAAKEGMVFAVRLFARGLDTISDFGAELKNMQVLYRANGGQTSLYRAIRESIELSVADAELTPEIKVHHVMVIVTDGLDSFQRPDDIASCREMIEKHDVNTTFIMMDFSPDGNAGSQVGLKGIPFSHNPKEFRASMKKLMKTIGEITDNVVKQLPPASGLSLPPAR